MRLRDRHGHPARADRRAVPARADRDEPAAGPGQPCRAADRHRGRASPACVFLRVGALVAGLPLADAADLRDRPAGGQRARGTAADDHARPRGRRAPDGAPAGAGQAADRRRDARLDRRDLHRQDRHAHRGPDGRSAALWADGGSSNRATRHERRRRAVLRPAAHGHPLQQRPRPARGRRLGARRRSERERAAASRPPSSGEDVEAAQAEREQRRQRALPLRRAAASG